MNYVVIKGTGSYVPENIITNADLEKLVETSDEWISSRTGIKERRISIDENTSDLAYQASLRALESAGLSPDDLDLIIVATLTPDAFTPSTACIVQKLLGAKRAAAFDINAACSGFIYSIHIAAQFIKTGVYKNVLVIGSEILSKIVDWSDRNTCVLFGDGAGAVVLSAQDNSSIFSVTIGADGAKGEALLCPALPVANPYVKEDCNTSLKSFIQMEGREVFRFATSIIADSIENLVKEQSITIEDIKYIVPHQANYRIIDSASKKLNIGIEKFYMNLDRFGNTSSASIPIALDEMNKKGMLSKGDKIVMVGFGGGLTYGAAIVEW